MDPGAEALASPAWMGIVVGGEEVFFEQVGAEDFSIELFKLAQPLSFGVFQVPGSFQEGEAGVLQIVAFFPGEPCDLLAADRVEGFVEEALDMEAVEDDLGVGAAPFDRFDEGVGHVDGHQQDGGAAILSELVEEPIQGLGGLTLSDPDGLAGFVVHDDGDVFVPALVGELVDADEAKPFQALGIELLADDPGRDAPDGDPGDLEEFLHGRLIGDPSESCDLILEVAGEEGSGSGPGDQLGPDAAAFAADPTQVGFEKSPDSQHRQVPPDTLLTVMNTTCHPIAAAASRHPSSRDDANMDFFLLETNRSNPEPLAREEPIK